MPRRRQSLTILTSQPLSYHSVVKILPAWPSKRVPSCHLLTNLASKRLFRRNLVQILRPAISKSRPTMPIFGDFGFQTTLSPQCGANFADILDSRSFALARFCDHIFCWRIFGGITQYSRKLDADISFLRILYNTNLSHVGYICLGCQSAFYT